ncbi:hypothetical protein [uncultured Aliiroseovarius sp.]|uniref:hypothetical protein n=1 Tax=uncultured Aliiroseovarius sp. TaxID=1658783 RepID=UPI002602056E|nr:hypothetical protein [uncultured Aliiroseovarius sp.]
MRYIWLGLLCATSPAFAHEAVIEGATATKSGTGWSVSVTLSHAEVGWEDYADGWRVETDAGDILGTRVLHHPHVDEQPFTRSLSGVAVPDGVQTLWLRARTSVEGWAQARFQLELPSE